MNNNISTYIMSCFYLSDSIGKEIRPNVLEKNLGKPKIRVRLISKR